MPINKIVVNDEIKLDLTADTVTPETLAEGVTAHDKSGAPIVGTMQSGGGGGMSWVTVANELPNPMYLLGDVNQDGSLTQDDMDAIFELVDSSSAVKKVLADVNFDKDINYIDAMFINEIKTGISKPAFTYATAAEYPDAKVGQDVKALFEVTISGALMTAPTFAYVPWDGIIAIYSNIQIPAGAAGTIQILK